MLTGKRKGYVQRINIMKCREYQEYYGFERKIKSKADTIIEVIYEAIYDILRGKKQEKPINF